MAQYSGNNQKAWPAVAERIEVESLATERSAARSAEDSGAASPSESAAETDGDRKRVEFSDERSPTVGLSRMNELRARLPEEIPHLRRYARALAGNPDEADDLVQECLERALTRASQWNPDKAARPWLFGILHNNFVSSVRKRRRQNELQRRYPAEETIHINYEQHCDLDMVHDAVQKLPSDQRDAIILVAVSGLSYEEASETLAVPVGTIRSRLSRAREGLRSLMSSATAGAEAAGRSHDREE
ncbi:RNA polymerase sigma factor [Aquisalimonas lutea]|uniref:RNA polymerase sigma factor n=1 Tax=Aquisalimonas lutea TaxID=1327750 RepID=UPI0025B5D1B0|nr:RNA polymerase sigma factor [Aquisalimonas lutea]MDN3519172.1 RNA polymerase sigma factor [Aquisalimonas lutea]